MHINSIICAIKPLSYNNYYQPLSFAGKFKSSDSGDRFTKNNNCNNNHHVHKQSKVYTPREIKENNIRDVLKYNLPCLCCGITMIPPEDINRLEKSGILNCKSSKAVEILNPYESRMHKTEKDIFRILKRLSKTSPDKTFKDLLRDIKPEHEKILTMLQFGIFRLIDKETEFFDEDIRKQIRAEIADAKDKIYEGENKFSRQVFCNNIRNILCEYRDPISASIIFNLAEKIPTSKDNVSAFVVKYANRKNSAIALRLITPSMGTVEHIETDINGGSDEAKNISFICSSCNEERGMDNIKELLIKHPEMFYNAQKQEDRLVELANSGILTKKYPVHLSRAYEKKSDHILHLDYSQLEKNKEIEKLEKSPLNLIDRKKKKDRLAGISRKDSRNKKRLY